MDLLLEASNLVKQYDVPPPAEPPRVLRGVSLRIACGEAVAITGPSGSGKSTLLNILGGLDRPTSGQVLLEGQDLAEMSDGELAAVRSRKIGLVFQLHHLLPQCTVLENVLLAALAAGSDDDEAPARARALLQRVGLGERMSYFPGRLSGGERQRVAVVRALVNRPRLLLADEPTGSLDRASAEDLANLLAELNRQQGVAMVVVTHSTALAERIGRVLTLRDGLLLGEDAGA